MDDPVPGERRAQAVGAVDGGVFREDAGDIG
jgi:hypothetical protein